MRRARLVLSVLVCAALTAGVAQASWYDDYDAGVNAIRKGQWQVAVQKMTAAIAGNPREGDKTRTYGAIFINYHPYYYRAVANMNLGKYEQAIADFEKTSGPGEENLGSLETLMQRAKQKLAEASEKPPVTDTKPPVVIATTTTQAPPATPTIDNALRARAHAALEQAKTHIQAAQQRKATASPQYQSALNAYTDANTRLAGAKSNDDLNAVIAASDNITLLADSANVSVIATTTTPTVVTTTTQSRTTAATQAALGDTSRRLRRALESYFNGDFDDATRGFQSLTQDMPKNGWIWAFLGASQYSQYAFEADENYKASALDSFRKAKTYGKWKDGLPEKYFSKKIRKAFRETTG
jgi:tetratricopeptide (TPR) repeat protein